MMSLRQEVAAPSSAAIASLEVVHRGAASLILDTDQSLAGLPPSVETQSLSLTDAACMTASTGRLGKMGNGKTTSKMQPITDGPADSSAYPQLSKCLKGSKDPVIAATKVRKMTVRDLGDLEAKATKAKEVCSSALGLIQDDFDDEEPLTFGVQLCLPFIGGPLPPVLFQAVVSQHLLSPYYHHNTSL